MRTHLLEMPDNPAEVTRWLEGHLVGLDLSELVAELLAVHPAPQETATSVQQLLGDRLDDVLDRGLADAPPEVVSELLRQPHLLFELQEWVLTKGGDYWNRVSTHSEDMTSRLETGRQRLVELITTQAQEKPSWSQAPPKAILVTWYRRPWFVSLATAATMLLAFSVYQALRTSTAETAGSVSPAWGWNKPTSRPLGGPAPAYLHRLSEAAEEWFSKRPEKPLALATRIAEFRQGCSKLILSNHEPLSDEDRRWLIVRCRLWAAKLDRHLATLEAGRDPLQVRDEADETIRDLIKAIRARGEEVASRTTG